MATSAGPESPLESPLSAIAVCVDGSPSAEHVLRYAFSLAGAASAEKHVKLRIVRVAVPSSPELEDITDDAPWLLGSRGAKVREDECKEARDAAWGELMPLVSSLADSHRPPNVELEILTPVAEGSIADTLVKTLTPQPPGICIIGSRGMGLTRKLLVGIADAILFAGLGSVSEELLHKAIFPVCIVRPSPEAHKKKEETASVSDEEATHAYVKRYGAPPQRKAEWEAARKQALSDRLETETEKEHFEEATDEPPAPLEQQQEDRVAEALDSAAL